MKLLKKLKTFLFALFWHSYNGFPKSSQNLIDYRFSICSSCDMFDRQNYQCLHCGCNINQQKILMNKLAWTDQKCPINKW